MSVLYEIPLLGPIIELLLTTVAPFLIVLSIVVFIHELGHYLVGRWCGIKADAFSIGFGKELLGWTDKHGTRWRVSALPLGGYVKFKGDADAASTGATDEVAAMSAAEKRETLTGAPIWARMLTIVAGPAANFLLTIILIFFVTLAIGVRNEAPVVGVVGQDTPASRAGLQAGDKIVAVDGAPISNFDDIQKALKAPTSSTKLVVEREDGAQTLTANFSPPATVVDVVYGGPADLACLRPGDVVTSVNGKSIASFTQLREMIGASEGATLDLTLDRNGETVQTELTPEVSETINPDTGEPERRYMIGVISQGGVGFGPGLRPASFQEAVVSGLMMPLTVAQQTFGYIGAWISGKVDGSSINSLFGIASVSGEAASLGLIAFVRLIALISAAIGLMNLLPVPVLDGGHLMFYTIEAIRGRPLGERWMEVATLAGLAAVLFLMVFATVNDLTPWLNKMSAQSC